MSSGFGAGYFNRLLAAVGDDPRIPGVGSHPSRARALGRADRDDGRERRNTGEILAYFRLSDASPPEIQDTAAFELRAARPPAG